MAVSLAIIQPMQAVVHAEGGYTLSGSIKVNSVPIANTSLTFRDSTGQSTLVGATDGSGNYTITDVPTGSYTLEYHYRSPSAPGADASGIPYDFNYHSVESGNQYPVIVAGDTTYNLNYQMPVKQFKVVDKYGNPVELDWVELYKIGVHPNDNYDVYNLYTRLTSDGGNVYNVPVLDGSDHYSFCVHYAAANALPSGPAPYVFDPNYDPINVWCEDLDPVDASQDTTITTPIIARPTNVHSDNAALPLISWNPVAGADHYEVRRVSGSGQYIELYATVETNSFVDETRPAGETVQYVVSAFDSEDMQSRFSSITVYGGPTFGAPTWSADLYQGMATTQLSIPIHTDVGSIQSAQYTLDGGVPQPMTHSGSDLWQATLSTANLEVGLHSVTITATDENGYIRQTTTGLTVLNPDPGNPTGSHMLGTPTWSVNPVQIDESDGLGLGMDTTLSVPVLNGVTGIDSVRLATVLDCCGYVEVPMTYDSVSGTWQFSFSGSDRLPAGALKFYIVATDSSGNDSASVSTTVYVGVQPPVPAAPTGLSVTTPTKIAPVLTWNSVSDVDHYDVYRDGTKVGSSTSANYTDTGANEGSHSYYVKAVSNFGASDPSNTVTVIYDMTGPTVNHSFNAIANGNGWFNTDVTVSFTCVDSLSGVQSCQSPITISTEGSNQSVSGTGTDNAGNSTTDTTSVKIDKTAPVASSPTLSTSLVLFSANMTMSANATDALSGVAGGEFYIDTDPGQGQGTPMTYSNGKITASKTITGVGTGQHKVYMRTKDKAGNWSAPVYAQFTYIGF